MGNFIQVKKERLIALFFLLFKISCGGRVENCVTVLLVETDSWIPWVGGLVLLIIALSLILIGIYYDEYVAELKETIWADFPPRGKN